MVAPRSSDPNAHVEQQIIQRFLEWRSGSELAQPAAFVDVERQAIIQSLGLVLKRQRELAKGV